MIAALRPPGDGTAKDGPAAQAADIAAMQAAPQASRCAPDSTARVLGFQIRRLNEAGAEEAAEDAAASLHPAAAALPAAGSSPEGRRSLESLGLDIGLVINGSLFASGSSRGTSPRGTSPRDGSPGGVSPRGVNPEPAAGACSPPPGAPHAAGSTSADHAAASPGGAEGVGADAAAAHAASSSGQADSELAAAASDPGGRPCAGAEAAAPRSPPPQAPRGSAATAAAATPAAGAAAAHQLPSQPTVGAGQQGQLPVGSPPELRQLLGVVQGLPLEAAVQLLATAAGRLRAQHAAADGGGGGCASSSGSPPRRVGQGSPGRQRPRGAQQRRRGSWVLSEERAAALQRRRRQRRRGLQSPEPPDSDPQLAALRRMGLVEQLECAEALTLMESGFYGALRDPGGSCPEAGASSSQASRATTPADLEASRTEALLLEALPLCHSPKYQWLQWQELQQRRQLRAIVCARSAAAAQAQAQLAVPFAYGASLAAWQGQPLGPQGPVWVPALHAGPQAPPLAAPLGLYRWQSSPWQLPRSAPPAPRLLAPSPPRTIPSSHPHMRLHGGSFGGSQRTAGTGDRSDPPAPDASFSPAASLGRSSLSPPQPRLHGASDQRGAGQAAGGGVSGSAPGDSVLQRQRAHLAQLKQQRQQLGVAGRQQQVMSQLMAGAGPPPPQQQQQYQQQGQQQQRAGLLSVQLQQGSADGGGGGAAAPAPEPQSPHLVGQQQPQPVMSRGVSNERRIRGASFAAAALGLPSPALSPLLEGLAGSFGDLPPLGRSLGKPPSGLRTSRSCADLHGAGQAADSPGGAVGSGGGSGGGVNVIERAIRCSQHPPGSGGLQTSRSAPAEDALLSCSWHEIEPASPRGGGGGGGGGMQRQLQAWRLQQAVAGEVGGWQGQAAAAALLLQQQQYQQQYHHHHQQQYQYQQQYQQQRLDGSQDAAGPSRFQQWQHSSALARADSARLSQLYGAGASPTAVAAAAAAALAAAAWAPGAGAEAASAAAGLVAAPRDLAGGLLGEGSGHGQTHYHVTKAMLGRQRVAFSHPTVTEAPSFDLTSLSLTGELPVLETGCTLRRACDRLDLLD